MWRLPSAGVAETRSLCGTKFTPGLPTKSQIHEGRSLKGPSIPFYVSTKNSCYRKLLVHAVHWSVRDKCLRAIAMIMDQCRRKCPLSLKNPLVLGRNVLHYEIFFIHSNSSDCFCFSLVKRRLSMLRLKGRSEGQRRTAAVPGKRVGKK